MKRPLGLSVAIAFAVVPAIASPDGSDAPLTNRTCIVVRHFSVNHDKPIPTVTVCDRAGPKRRSEWPETFERSFVVPAAELAAYSRGVREHAAAGHELPGGVGQFQALRVTATDPGGERGYVLLGRDTCSFLSDLRAAASLLENEELADAWKLVSVRLACESSE